MTPSSADRRSRARARRLSATLLTLTLFAGLAACGTTDQPVRDSATVVAGTSTERGATARSSDDSASSDDAASPAADTFEYVGRDGTTVLDLLVEADPSAEVTGSGAQAYVVGIGGRRADDAKKEFWSLSVNGKPATVGAGALRTTTGDRIAWTLETY